MFSIRKRRILRASAAIVLASLMVCFWRSHYTKPSAPIPSHPRYKALPTVLSIPVVDNFPLASSAQSAADLPPIPSWNQPPSSHLPENTPLFIGFTRNWPLLQQAVVSYITAGWPPSDIYVVENTGVMNSNKEGRLSLQNPFFLNHTRLHILGVNVLITPTLFTFAQLQNFYLYQSIEYNWTHFFWSHMDIVALSFENQYAAANQDILKPSDPRHDYSDFESIYIKSVKSLRNATSPDPETGIVKPWAMRYFSYDRLTLVNVAAFVEAGAWDISIPYYMTDCDMYARLEMMKFDIQETISGLFLDVGSSFDDLIVLYRKKGTVDVSFTDPNLIEQELLGKGHVVNVLQKSPKEVRLEKVTIASGGTPQRTTSWGEDEIYSESWQKMIHVLDDMHASKEMASRGRNGWQTRQTGGLGDPFYRDSEGFDKAVMMTIMHGKAVFREKWGHRDCDILQMGLKPSDAWRVAHDWKD